MRILKDEQLVEVRNHMAGGAGSVTLNHFLSKEEAYTAGRLFAVNTLLPGCSIGYHKHTGEFEIYYILEGTAEITEDGEIYELHEGDMMQCKDGSSHGIANKSHEPLRFLALILNV